jgi:hypothetical protein
VSPCALEGGSLAEGVACDIDDWPLGEGVACEGDGALADGAACWLVEG